MTREEAKTIFLNRGYIEVDGGSYFDGNKWRESIAVISEWLKEEPCEVITRIPKDYLYDTETEDVLVYRHKYTGKEIHIEKPVKRYRIEPCEDAISRQAVMDCFKKWQPYLATRIWSFEQELSALPSVNPQEPKAGQELETIKKLMLEYGFTAPDMTVTEFVEDILSTKETKRNTFDCLKCIHYGFICDLCNNGSQYEGETIITIKR